MSTDLAPRLKGRYKSEIAPALKVKFGYKNVMQIPTLTKVVVTWVLVKQRVIQS